MHICIIGTGATGWIVANHLKSLPYIQKVTVVGSSKIPPIGVGESNTLTFMILLNNLIRNREITFDEFIKETDAAVKYGVYYQNWSRRDYLHYFKSNNPWKSVFDEKHYGRLLANKHPWTYIHDILGKEVYKFTKKNLVSLDQDNYYRSYHFDAAKFINFFSKVALKNGKVSYIDAIVKGGQKANDKINFIVTEDNQKIEADYFVFATGDSSINEKFLNIEYESLQKYLLTDTALVYPLEYKNKKDQFHPYTVAKTMKNGWRWITPTYSRIGTGYVFSSNHVSVDEATNEFLRDIGDRKITPSVVNFTPKYNPKPFHKNWSTIGMSQGFLEPLDAPGLTITIDTLFNQLEYYLFIYNSYLKEDPSMMSMELDKLNDIVVRKKFHFWCSFILCQYKTCYRNDTKFWKDHKEVQCDFYDQIMNNLDIHNDSMENFMFQQTIASKDIQWKTSLKSKPYVVKDAPSEKIHHLDYISKFHKS